MQRSRHLLDNRAALVGEIETLRASNVSLAEKLEDVPKIKSELSYARADNQRARHVQTARDNLVVQLKAEKALSSQHIEKLSSLPELKHRLSSANAENARLQHVAAARDTLMRESALMKDKYSREIDLKKRTNVTLAKRLQVIPALKRDLSFARAENQRAVHVSTARDNLILQLKNTKGENAELSEANSQQKIVRKELSLARARNARLQHVSVARDNLKRELLDLRQKDTENSAEKLLKEQLVTARAENEKLQRMSKALESSSDEATTTAAELQKNIDELKVELVSAKDWLADNDLKLTEQDAILAITNDELTSARFEIDSLKKERSDLMQARDNALDEIGKLQELVSAEGAKNVEPTDDQGALKAEVKSADSDVAELITETLALRNSIGQQIAKANLDDIDVKSIENGQAVAISLGSNTLYRSGDVSLSREGSLMLNKIGKILEKYPSWRIDVEGHTDSTPIGPKLKKRYPTNWELSSARASAVVSFFRLTSSLKTESLSAKGYAETQPVADNGSAQGREKNRRVDIVLRR